MDPNSSGAQSFFDTNIQARPTLEGANPFGAQSWLELNFGGSQVLVGANDKDRVPSRIGLQKCWAPAKIEGFHKD